MMKHRPVSTPMKFFQTRGLSMIRYGDQDFVIVTSNPIEPEGTMRYVCRKPNGRSLHYLLLFNNGTYTKMNRMENQPYKPTY